MSYVLCDANVFYNLGNPDIDLDYDHLTNMGADTPVVSPIVALEILSNVNENNFQYRQHAAVAALQHGDMLPTPEYELAEAWEIQDGSGGECIHAKFLALLADSKSCEQYRASAAKEGENFESAIISTMGGESGKKVPINADYFKLHVDHHEADYVERWLQELEKFFPGYREALNNNTQQPKKAEAEKRAKALAMPVFRFNNLVSTYIRACISAYCDHTKINGFPTEHQTMNANGRLDIYLRALQSIAVDAVKGLPVEPNDLEDLEYFIHVKDDMFFATSEKAWHRRAEEYGYDQYMRRPIIKSNS